LSIGSAYIPKMSQNNTNNSSLNIPPVMNSVVIQNLLNENEHLLKEWDALLNKTGKCKLDNLSS
jgi:hypothetical protein